MHDSTEQHGSFTTIARLLKSPSLPEPTMIGDLLAALPLTQQRASWSGRPPALLVRNHPQSSGYVVTSSPKILAEVFGLPAMPGLLDGDLEAKRRWVREYLAQNYPILSDALPLPDGHPWVRPTPQGGMWLMLEVDAGTHTGSDSLREQILYTRTRRVGDSEFALPRLGTGEEGTLHPLIPLWASLWTFSMLARYEPVRWAKLVNVDASPDAIALEEVLEDSLDLVPWFLLDALGSAP